ncbi:hypothetical protein DVH24_033724 [Malus domestica]|uniref:Uncharacterized protein n=1 Tax=Malus domestica TaxID=3750 RepID=A0A498HL26_MALDO|nr:hypothetical protein DVH24_033724 [Malus domestica]
MGIQQSQSAYHLFEKSSSYRNYNSSSCRDSRWMKRSGVILKPDPAYVLLFKPYGQPLSSIKVDQLCELQMSIIMRNHEALLI